MGPEGLSTIGPDTATVILAAGGVELDALEWSDSHESPLAVPAIVVGADPGRRVAAQLVARGASDYFALPERCGDPAKRRGLGGGKASRGSENCSALPAHLVESELFGDEPGAYTDAHAAKPGLFEVAEGGTLFLDEIGTLSADLQVKLLRALDDKHVRRVGGTKSRQVNVRIIAATNENLDDSIESGAFREDLFFRLSVITLTLPPLRNRGDDILIVAEKFLRRLAKQHRLPVPKLDAEVRHALLAHRWPGNVRELKNAVERALR